MGEVYEAQALELNRRVAIKRVLDGADRDNDEIQALFLREVAIAATLEHQNVVEVLDAGQMGPDLYLVMEFVEGPSLAELLDILQDNDRILPTGITFGIVSAVANGLAHAHERALPDGTPLKIIHRDIAPENVLIGLDGIPKVVDFGVGKIMGHSLTQPGVVRGRPQFLSPEQAKGDNLDHRSDIFSMGALLFQMVSGDLLYPNDNVAKLLWKVASGDYGDLRTRLPSADPDLIDIINTAAAPNRDHRFKSARHFERRLSSYRAARGLPMSSRAVAEIVSMVWPTVQAQRAQRMMESKGELEGMVLNLVAEIGDASEMGTRQSPRAPKGAPPPRAPKQPIRQPPPRAKSQPAAFTAPPLPMPEAPALALSQTNNFANRELGWVIYLGVILLAATLAFFYVWGQQPVTGSTRAPTAAMPTGSAP